MSILYSTISTSTTIVFGPVLLLLLQCIYIQVINHILAILYYFLSV
jgi:hypothetical protein